MPWKRPLTGAGVSWPGGGVSRGPGVRGRPGARPGRGHGRGRGTGGGVEDGAHPAPGARPVDAVRRVVLPGDGGLANTGLARPFGLGAGAGGGDGAGARAAGGADRGRARAGGGGDQHVAAGARAAVLGEGAADGEAGHPHGRAPDGGEAGRGGGGGDAGGQGTRTRVAWTPWPFRENAGTVSARSPTAVAVTPSPTASTVPEAS
ncbi:hypothetical protein ACFRMQ_38870 [Kitasatospora sp. NPDC056783]|uniref:hypothetical protein n=1 Tax=Kitasatospora sp. NPDC056783 TaxID=3345943 RepID=UPI00368D4579